ncbi:hypothetical protein [Burkholderia cenocepacia]|uniref:hypothetical protein n=1 Tax=Burkholderia cenocepacia TaxID=95486 RepID=UPI000A939D8D|nr:hypothetical protein [Burkholderia cenocepacia]
MTTEQPEVLTFNEQAIEVAAAALEAQQNHPHFRNAVLEPRMQVWCLLVWLQEYCAKHGIDFNRELNSGRAVADNVADETPGFKRALPTWEPLR